MATVKDLLEFINAEVGGLTGPASRAMIPILAAAEKELTADLKRWIAIAPGMEEKFTAQAYRAALLQIRHSLNEIAAMEPQVYQALVGNAHMAGTLAVKHLIDEVKTFGPTFEGTIRPIPFHVASIIAQGDKMLIPRHRTSAARYTGQVRADITNQLALGMVRGETMDQLVRRLIRHGGPKGTVAMRGILGNPNAIAEEISEGLFTRYNHWAERLARTEVIHAYNVQAAEGVDELAEDDPEIRKRWDAALDGRLCDFCKRLDDLVVKPGESFPGGVRHPPLHPNCRCALVVWHKDWTENPHREVLGGPKIFNPPPKMEIPEIRREPGKPGGSFKIPDPPKPPKVKPDPGPAAVKPPAPVIPAVPAPRAPRAPRVPRVRVPENIAEQAWVDAGRRLPPIPRNAPPRPPEPRFARRTQEELDILNMMRASTGGADDWAEIMENVFNTPGTGDFMLQSLAARVAREIPSAAGVDIRALLADHLQTSRGLRASREWREKWDPFHKLQQREAAKEAARKAKEEARLQKEKEKAAKAAAKAAANSHKAVDAQVRKEIDARAREPMASDIHPAQDFTGYYGGPEQLARDRKRFEDSLEHTFGKRIPLEEITHAFAPPPGFVMKLQSMGGSRGGEAEISWEIWNDKGEFVGTLVREFRPDKSIYHSLFKLHKDFQGGGLSDQVNWNAMSRYEKWGVKKVEVTAAWVGRYAWARLGFNFKHPDQIRRAFQSYVDKHPNLAARKAKLMQEIEALLETPWVLADWHTGELFPDEFNDPPKGPFPLGKAFLLSKDNGGCWSGEMKVGKGRPGYTRAMRTTYQGKGRVK